MGLFEQMGLQYGDAPEATEEAEETAETAQDDYQEENSEQ